MTDDDQVMQCAADQAVRDMYFVEVTGVSIFKKMILKKSTTGDRWYVEVNLRHRVDGSEAAALYRVWRDQGSFKAIKVDIR